MVSYLVTYTSNCKQWYVKSILFAKFSTTFVTIITELLLTGSTFKHGTVGFQVPAPAVWVYSDRESKHTYWWLSTHTDMHAYMLCSLGAVDDNPAGTCHAYYTRSYDDTPPYCLLSDGGNLCSEGYIPSLNKTGLVGIPFVGYPVGYYTQVGSSCPCSCMDINGPSPPQDYLKQHNCNVQTEGSYGKQINCLDVMK